MWSERTESGLGNEASGHTSALLSAQPRAFWLSRFPSRIRILMGRIAGEPLRDRCTMEVRMDSPEEWAARIKAEAAARTPEQVTEDEAKFREWLANLPILPPPPTKPGEVQAIFIKRKAKHD